MGGLPLCFNRMISFSSSTISMGPPTQAGYCCHFLLLATDGVVLSLIEMHANGESEEYCDTFCGWTGRGKPHKILP